MSKIEYTTEQLEIAINNKLIAEFMGGVYQKKMDVFDGRIHETITFGQGVFRDQIWNGSQRCATTDHLFELHYHDLWYWLMPVVEKIESIFNYVFEISGSDCFIVQKITDKLEISLVNIVSVFGETKIKSVYDSVVYFLKNIIHHAILKQ